jgi:hypothetical protein
MKTITTLFALGLLATTARAQKLPDAPTPRLTLTLYAARAAARSLDVVSTNRVLGLRGGYEYELPPWIVNHTERLVGFEAAVVGAEMLAEGMLRRHGHPRLALLVPALDAAGVSVTVAMNYRVRPTPPPAPHGTPIRRQP